MLVTYVFVFEILLKTILQHWIPDDIRQKIISQKHKLSLREKWYSAIFKENSAFHTLFAVKL